MVYINKNILERELFYDNTLILKYHIEYPSIMQNKTFSDYNEKLAIEVKNRSEHELYESAIETYKYNKENGYPIMVYEVYRTFEITYNMYNFVSLYIDEYIYAGGAHGNTIRTSQNWNLYQNCMILLEQFFPNNPYFMIEILKEINRQIANNPDIYFDDTCNLVLGTFNPQNYYLTLEGIVIYFQAYDIAPYSSGIREFLVKYQN